MNTPSHVFQLQCAPIPIVRIALIGLGGRGLKTLQRYTDIPGTEIRCLADLDDEAVERACQHLALSGRPVARTLSGPEAWREACALTDIDLVYICTDWESHADIAIAAMEHGHHVAVEVPLATTVADCRRVVETAERTQRHCFLTENCCYDAFHLATLQLVESGALGTLTHCDGAYIHDWRPLFGQPASRRHDGPGGAKDIAPHLHSPNFYEESARHGGNPYPTHAIGPIAQLLGFHRTDRMVSLVSMTGNRLGDNSPLGHTSTTLIRTARGVTVTLQFDATTPRPYSRNQAVCGTAGFVQKYPLPTVQLDGAPLLTGEAAETYMKRQMISPAARAWQEGHRLGVDNEMNYAMDRRLIHCLRHGLPLDIDVYDAAEWSCLAELTRLSAQQGGAPVEIPQFLLKKV